jgi:exodeoxyribonuclease VII large subunit
LVARLDALHQRIAVALVRGLEQRMQQVDYLGRRLAHPGERIRGQEQHLAHLGVTPAVVAESTVGRSR